MKASKTPFNDFISGPHDLAEFGLIFVLILEHEARASVGGQGAVPEWSLRRHSLGECGEDGGRADEMFNHALKRLLGDGSVEEVGEWDGERRRYRLANFSKLMDDIAAFGARESARRYQQERRKKDKTIEVCSIQDKNVSTEH